MTAQNFLCKAGRGTSGGVTRRKLFDRIRRIKGGLCALHSVSLLLRLFI